MTTNECLELADECIRLIPVVEPRYRRVLVRMSEEWLRVAKTLARTARNGGNDPIAA